MELLVLHHSSPNQAAHHFWIENFLLCLHCCTTVAFQMTPNKLTEQNRFSGAFLAHFIAPGTLNLNVKLVV